MALIDKAFDVQNGVSLGDKVGIFYSDTSPNTNGSLDSPKGSLILHVPTSGEPQLWKKFGSGSLEWKKLQTKTHTSTGLPSVTNDDVDTAGVGITFEPGDLWVNTTTSTGFYICFSNTTGAAVWRQPSSPVNFETSTSNIKMDGSVSVGALSTIPRSDHIHPSDTSKQNTLTIGNLTTSTGLLVSNGTGAVIGSGTVLSLPQAIGTSDSPTFVDITLSSLHRTVGALGTDTKMATGIPFSERGKFKVDITYSAPNIVATISFVGANTSFSYYINGKKFTVTSTELSAYTKSATAAEGTWYFYINQTTTLVGSPDLSLSQTAWTIYDPDVLLWNAYFNATANTVTWVGEERHTAGRDIYNHARNHAQGALYKSGLLFSQYNGLTTFSSNTDNNFGRAQAIVSSGSFYDEDIQNTITHTDASITSTTASPATDWNLTVNQFLGFTALATTGTNATTIVFTTTRTLATGQAVAVMTGNTTTIRGTTTISSGGTGTSFTVASVTGLASGDAIVIAARIPIYYISAVVGGVYTWRKLTSTDFLGVSGGVAITAATIASATCQYNNATAGGFATITANRFYPIYLIATNMTSEPVVAVLGQGQSTNATLATALGEAPFQFSNLVGLTGLGIQEAVPFYRLTYHYNTGGAFSTTRIKVVDVTFLNLRVATVSGTVIGSSPSTMAASQVTTDTTNFSNILTTSETTVQAALDKLDDFQNTYVTVANAEAATGVDNKLCYVVETETWYRYEATGSAYTDDNKYVLSTGDGGNTRWVGVAGKYLWTDTNVFSGFQSMFLNSSALYNAAYGYNSLYTISSGQANAAFGRNALYSLSASSNNTAFGDSAGYATTGSYNTYVGSSAGYNASSGSNNTAIGYSAYSGNSAATGGNNTFIGYQSGINCTSAGSNSGIGYRSFYSLSTGNYNVAIGTTASYSNIIGTDNINIGYSAGYHNMGSEQYAIGTNALYGIAPVYEVIQITVNSATLANYVGDYFVLHSGISGLNTSARRGFWFDTTGSDAAPTFTADNKIKITITGLSDTTAIATAIKTAIATDTTYFTTASTTNVVTVTYKLARENTLSTNGCSEITLAITARGTGTNGEISNVAIGQNTLYVNTNGFANVAVGRYCLQNNKIGVYNIACGYNALGTNKTGNQNTAIGVNALYENVVYSDNVAIGYLAARWLAGLENVAIGTNALLGMGGASSVAEVTTITVNSATLANYVGDYFRFYNGSLVGYSNYVTFDFWFDTTGSDSVPGGCTGTVVTRLNISSCTTTAQIATVIKDAFNEYVYSNVGRNFSAVAPASVVTVTHLNKMQHTDATGASASEITINVTTQGTGNSAYYSVAIGYYSQYSNTLGVQNTSIGHQSLRATTSGNNNTAIGVNAGLANTTGSNGVFIGSGAGQTATTVDAGVYIGYRAGLYSTGASNIFIGSQAAQGVTGQTTTTMSVAIGTSALIGITTGTSNTVIGYQSFYTATTNGYNTALGWDTGYYTTSSYNTFVGYSAGMNVTSGANNTSLGYQAGKGTGTPTWATGSNNVSIGYNAGLVLTTGGYNSFLGSSAGVSVTSGEYNIFIGYQAGYTYNTGTYAIGIGKGALYSATSAQAIAIGWSAGYKITTNSGLFIGTFAGSNVTGTNNVFLGADTGKGDATTCNGVANVAVGNQAFTSFTTASNCCAFGTSALTGVTEGTQNIGIGNSAGYTIVTGSDIIALGYRAAYTVNSNEQIIAIGTDSFYSLTESYNIGIGYKAGYFYNGSSGIFVGRYAGYGSSGQTTGNNNIAIGDYSLYKLTSGSSNSAFGLEAGYSITDTGSSTLIGRSAGYLMNGGYNTAVGMGSLYGTTAYPTGEKNSALGYHSLYTLISGSGNIAIGYQAGDTLKIGTNNIIIGYDADVGASTTNSIVIGAGAATSTGNQILIGSSSTDSTIIKGIYGNTDGTNSYVRVGSDGTLYEDNNPVSGGGVATFITVAAAETSTGLDNDLCYVVETETFYRYETTSTGYTVDHKYILATGAGGVTRWLGVSGRYNISQSDAVIYVDESTASAGQTKFPLSAAPAYEDSITVSVDGVIQNSSYYTFFSSTGIAAGLQFTAPFLGGEEVRIQTLGSTLSNGSANILSEVITVTYDGQTSVTMAYTPISKDLIIVSIDGVFQNSSSYDYIGTTLAFSDSLLAGNKVYIIYIFGLSVVLPPENSITRAYLADVDIYKFSPNIAQNIVMAENGLSVGTVSINNGYTVEIGDGYTWAII